MPTMNRANRHSLPIENVLETVMLGRYRIECFDHAETWLVKSQPAPENWHELVYRISVCVEGFWYDIHSDDNHFTKRAAQLGHELVMKYKALQAQQATGGIEPREPQQLTLF